MVQLAHILNLRHCLQIKGGYRAATAECKGVIRKRKNFFYKRRN